MPEYDHLHHIVVVGFSGAGKTSICVRFARDDFHEQVDERNQPAFYQKDVLVDKKINRIQLSELLGENKKGEKTLKGSGIRDKTLLKKPAAVIVCYDVTDKNSFDLLDVNLTVLKNILKKNTPIILMGNKSDLSDLRKVTDNDGKALAEKHGLFFMETSARNNINIESAMSTLVEEIHKSALVALEDKIESAKQLKLTIDAFLTAYQYQGNKFIFFAKSADRKTTLDQLERDLQPIFDEGSKKGLDHKQHIQIAYALYKALNETNESHKKGSLAGALGWTTSRLASSLQACLYDFLRITGVTIEEVIAVSHEKGELQSIKNN